MSNDPVSQFFAGLGQSWDQSSWNPFRSQPTHPAGHPAAQPAHPASRYTPIDPVDNHEWAMPTWLLLVKAEGAHHGLGNLASHINITANHQGQLFANVDDPAIMRQLADIRDDQDLTQALGRDYRAHHNNQIPPVYYPGATTTPDQQLLRDQQNLDTLGYDIGVTQPNGLHNAQTDTALREFQAQAHPPIAAGTLHTRLQQAAQQATADATHLSRPNVPVTPDVAYSLRNAAAATGVDYNYLTQLTARESHFDSDIRPVIREARYDRHHRLVRPERLGGAVGLFQMEPATWLNVLRDHGADYGLGSLAHQVTGDRAHPTIANAATRDYVLGLREDPHLNALLGAELQRENQQVVRNVAPRLANNPGAIYSVHFLGNNDAEGFLTGLRDHPDSSAAATLPTSVTGGANHGVFFTNGHELTFREVFQKIERSFGITPSAPDATATTPRHPTGHRR